METLITFVTLIIVIIQVWTWILFIKTTFNVQKINKVIVDKKNESEQIICEDIRRDLVTINIIVASCNDNEKAKKLIQPFMLNMAKKCMDFSIVKDIKGHNPYYDKKEDIEKRKKETYTDTFMNHVGVHLTHISEMLGADLSMYSNYDYVRQFCPDTVVNC